MEPIMETTEAYFPVTTGFATNTHTNVYATEVPGSDLSWTTTDRPTAVIGAFFRLLKTIIDNCAWIWPVFTDFFSWSWAVSADTFLWLGGIFMVLCTWCRGKMGSVLAVMGVIPLMAYPLALVMLVVFVVIYRIIRRFAAARLQQVTPVVAPKPGQVTVIPYKVPQAPHPPPTPVTPTPFVQDPSMWVSANSKSAVNRDQYYGSRLLPQVRTACASEAESQKVTGMLLKKSDATLDNCLSDTDYLASQASIMLVTLRLSPV